MRYQAAINYERLQFTKEMLFFLFIFFDEAKLSFACPYLISVQLGNVPASAKTPNRVCYFGNVRCVYKQAAQPKAELVCWHRHRICCFTNRPCPKVVHKKYKALRQNSTQTLSLQQTL